MILADTSIWIDHIRSADEGVSELLDGGRILCHPFVRGEVALGQFRERGKVLTLMGKLQSAEIASDAEVMALIERYRLCGSGIGYVDAHLLTSSFLTLDCQLWTRDKRLGEIAHKLGVAAKGMT